jgi:transposase
LGIPVKTIYGKRKKFLLEGNLNPKPRTGRPQKTSARDRRLICRLSRKDPFMSAGKIKFEIGRNDVSTKTIKRVLFKSGGLKSRMAAKKPYLRNTNRLNRLRWAREHQNWTIDQWKEILWSDESKFCIRNHASRRVYRPVGMRYDSKYTQKTVKHDKSVMVWGCFCYAGTGRLHRINGIMNAPKYRTILSTQLFPSARDLFGGSRWVFQQDNDPKHTSKLVERYLSRKRVNILEWPSQSLDLNPIEHLWSKLESDLKTRDCNTEDQLMNVLQEVWDNIDQHYMKKLIESMPIRCRAVIKARGQLTKY